MGSDQIAAFAGNGDKLFGGAEQLEPGNIWAFDEKGGVSIYKETGLEQIGALAFVIYDVVVVNGFTDLGNGGNAAKAADDDGVAFRQVGDVGVVAFI